jgi:hypothetical protein
MLVASIVYPILASWAHGGFAPFSILALMSGTTMENTMEMYHGQNRSQYYSPELLTQITPSSIVSTLTFTIGLIYVSLNLLKNPTAFQLICGVFRVQFLAEYFSAPLVRYSIFMIRD